MLGAIPPFSILGVLVLKVKHSDSFTYPWHGHGMQQLLARGVVYFILPDLKIISVHNKFFN